jgi:hypothetical protein
VDGCIATYRKWDSFRKHIQRSHPNVYEVQNDGAAEEIVNGFEIAPNDFNEDFEPIEEAGGNYFDLTSV